MATRTAHQLVPCVPSLRLVCARRHASLWMSQYDLEAMLDASGGLVRIPNFLPDHVAKGVQGVIKGIPQGRYVARAVAGARRGPPAWERRCLVWLSARRGRRQPHVTAVRCAWT